MEVIGALVYVSYVSCEWHDLVVSQDVWRPYGSDRCAGLCVICVHMCHVCDITLLHLKTSGGLMEVIGCADLCVICVMCSYVSCVWRDLVAFRDVWRRYGSDSCAGLCVICAICVMCDMTLLHRKTLCVICAICVICVMCVTWPCCIPRRLAALWEW